MEAKAISILSKHTIMAIATNRPDGWPQNTVVDYANDGLLIYFLVSRSGQKYANILRDERVAITLSGGEHDLSKHMALSLGAFACEVTDHQQRDEAVKLLLDRHPKHRQFGYPDFTLAAMMRAHPQVVTILDYTKGAGHADEFMFGASNTVEMLPSRTNNWGWTPAPSEAAQQ